MNQLIKTDVKMTSLDIAEVTGKRHDNVMSDIRKEIKELGEETSLLIFKESTYTNKRGREYPCYTFGKKGAMQLALKYDAKTRYRVIEYIEELESNQDKPSYMISDPVDRAKKWIEEHEEKKLLEESNVKKDQLIGELKPKADYTDIILKNKSLMTITQIAKDYGMSGQAMNRLLNELGVQYKQSDQWLLYSKYHDKGYTHSETIPITRKSGMKDIVLTTKWTQKGRLFLYNLLRDNNILPIIEQEDAS